VGTNHRWTSARPVLLAALTSSLLAAGCADPEEAKDGEASLSTDASDVVTSTDVDPNADVGTRIDVGSNTDVVTSVDVGSNTDVVMATDGVTADAGATDVPVAMDVPVAVDVPVAMDVATDRGPADAGPADVPVDVPSVERARPMTPPSGSRLTSRRPVFRWALPSGAARSQLQLCADRACTRVLETIMATARNARPTADLPYGVFFWRVASLDGPSANLYGPTWEATVEGRATTAGSYWGDIFDANGDGRADLLTAAFGTNGWEGTVAVYEGGPSGLPSAPTTTFVPPFAQPSATPFVESAGDVNGDGYSDVIVFRSLGNTSNTPHVTLFHGGPSGISTRYAQDIALDRGMLAFRARSVGDFDGDGYGDIAVLVTATAAPNPAQLWFYRGGPGGISSSRAWTLTQLEDLRDWSYSFGSPGDLDADGASELFWGAPSPTMAVRHGRLRVFRGRATGPADTADVLLTDPGTSTIDLLAFGYVNAAAGDLNGDGLPDLLVSEQPAGGNLPGDVYGYLAGPSLLAATPAVHLVGTSERFSTQGVRLAGLGDLDGDGYGDFAVMTKGAPTTSSRVHAYRGAPTGAITTPTVRMDNPSGGTLLGLTAADFNGDLRPDLVTSNPNAADFFGEVYLYQSASGALPATPTRTLSSPAGITGRLGRSLAAGDINRDGYPDIVAGEWSLGAAAGRAWVYQGGAMGLATSAPTRIVDPGAAVGDRFGWAVASAGDVNNDGFADVLVGAEGRGSGHALLYLGGASGLRATPATDLAGAASGDRFGAAAVSVGDINGDGFGDVAVGAPEANGTAGAVYLFRGSASGFSASAAQVLASPGGAGARFGSVLTRLRDGDGDGRDELVVGAPGLGGGRVYVFAGAAGGFAPTPRSTLSVPAVGSQVFGFAIIDAGDVNHDGRPDLAASGYDLALGNGRVYLFSGGAGGALTLLSTSTRSAGSDASQGASLVALGDWNGDGFADVACGGSPVPPTSTATNTGGVLGIYLGSATGLGAINSMEPALTISGTGRFGYAAVAAGDLDRNGEADFVFGTPAAGPIRAGNLAVVNHTNVGTRTPVITAGTDTGTAYFSIATTNE
jgi:hypothetical protein